MTSATTSLFDIENPPDEIEEALCKEISLIVGQTVDRDTDLVKQCDLDSFVITQIMVFLEQAFEIDIPDERLNSESYSSISHIAGWVRAIRPKKDVIAAFPAQPENMSYRVVDLAKRTGSDPAVFIAPTQSGMHFRYKDLINYFPENLQIKGLQIRLSDPDPKHTPDIKSMAAAMVEVMRKEQPDGPYHLLGFCFGASLATEMAERLSQQNEQVGFLGLIDVLLPDVNKQDVPEIGEVIGKTQGTTPVEWLKRKISWHASALSILNPGEYLPYGLKIVSDRFRKRNSDEAREMGSNSVDQLIDATHRAFANYDPSVYTGAVNIFEGTLDGAGRHASAELVARNFTGPTTITKIPGFHSFMLEDPWVRILGREISVQLKNSLRHK